MSARPSYYMPEPARCGVCHQRHRSSADAFACERAHDAEAATNPKSEDNRRDAA